MRVFSALYGDTDMIPHLPKKFRKYDRKYEVYNGIQIPVLSGGTLRYNSKLLPTYLTLNILYSSKFPLISTTCTSCTPYSRMLSWN